MKTIDAETVWRILSDLGVERLPGSSNDTIDYLISKSGQPYILPFSRRGDRSKYLKIAFDSILEQLRSS